MLEAIRFDAPKFEAARTDDSRGGPRTALAPAREPAVAPRDAEPSPPAVVIGRFEELIALAAHKRDLAVKLALERDVRLVRFEEGRLEIALEPSAGKSLVHDLARKFSQWTGRRWIVVVSAEAGQPTVKSQNDARQAELKTGVAAHPLVQAVLDAFSRSGDRGRPQSGDSARAAAWRSGGCGAGTAVLGQWFCIRCQGCA